MLRIRAHLVAALVVGLLAGSTVGVAAQEEGRAAPVEVTGTSVEGACPGGSSTKDGLVDKTRGWVCPHTWTTSDARLDGTFTRSWNLDWYEDGTGLVFGYATGRLENADGAWQQRPGLRGGSRANRTQQTTWSCWSSMVRMPTRASSPSCITVAWQPTPPISMDTSSRLSTRRRTPRRVAADGVVGSNWSHTRTGGRWFMTGEGGARASPLSCSSCPSATTTGRFVASSHRHGCRSCRQRWRCTLSDGTALPDC